MQQRDCDPEIDYDRTSKEDNYGSNGLPRSYYNFVGDKTTKESRKRVKSLQKWVGGDESREIVSFREHSKAIQLYFEGLDCPRALTCWLLYSNMEHNQLVDLECSHDHYSYDNRDFRDAYAATLFLSKADFLLLKDADGKPVDTSKVALEKFLECERGCGVQNRKFATLETPDFNPKSWAPGSVNMLSYVRDEIRRILDGRQADARCEDDYRSSFCPLEWVDSCAWGPGSTAQISGLDVSSVHKFQIESGITLDLYDLIGPLIPMISPLWAGHLGGKFSFESCERILFVPKNAKTKRVIGANPGLNVFFQIGLGRMMVKRLRNATGIDLLSQERNGLLCFYGSLTGKLVTVDFSSASDTISREVVRFLFPQRWYTVMDAARSRCGKIGDGDPVIWEKFSSMGNGFTFPLQSIIFTAAAIAACKCADVSSEYVGVFGDDVILPKKAYAIFRETCETLGFRISSSKSFTEGYFRESCGTHYSRGTDCKPIYLKEKLADVHSIYKLANAIRRLAHRHRSYNGCRASLYPAWRYLVGKIPTRHRLWIPEGFGDGGFVGNLDETGWSVFKPGYWLEGWFAHAIECRSGEIKTEGLGLLLARLFSRSERELGNSNPVRGALRNKVVRFLADRWYELGTWQ